MEVLYRLSYRGIFRLCGGGRIRTSVGEAGRFTVCSLWPLGHTPGHAPAALCAERPNMVANATDFSTDREGTAGTFDREPGKGFEPPTGRLQGGCSTSELPGRAAAGGAPHAGFARLRKASPACQHAPASGLRLSARSGLAASTCQHASGLKALACQQESFETNWPARTIRSRDCNSANPAPTSSFC
jgi:hypothetical protein